MCLPHCPTYLATQLESESPRGRIAIIQGLINKQISSNKTALAHIDNCLTCRACEKICPSDVNYGALLDQFKIKTKGTLQAPQKRILKSLIRFVLQNSTLNSWMITNARLFGLKNLIGLSNYKPTHSQAVYFRNKTLYPTHNLELQAEKLTIGLFVGCTGSSFDKQTLNDVIVVLNTIGFDVKLSQPVKCCGALDSHSGNQQAAIQLATDNIKQFHNLNVDHIVYFASGCGAQLSEYHQFNWTTAELREDAVLFTSKLSEVTKFIHQHWPDKVDFVKTVKTIAIHEPCTHRNVLKESDIGSKLMSRISGITILPLTENKLCCGAAGDYMMTHKKMANTLRAPKLHEITQLAPDIVLTTNVGCALHLRKGLSKNNQAIPVMHPVSLIAELIKKT